MNREELENRKILVIGMGKSGTAAARALHGLGADVSCQDSRAASGIDPVFRTWAGQEGIPCFFGSEPEGGFDLIVPSPGVPTDIPLITRLRAEGAEVAGELEIAYRMGHGHYVAITGTNGKTTTTTLVGDIFQKSGRKTDVVGNIGVAVISKAIDAEEDEWLITEASSFQLETVQEFRPVVSAILNLTPDHLNRHKTMEAYGQAKANIFRRQTKEDYLVVNYDDPVVRKLSEEAEATVLPFSRKEELEAGAYLLEDQLVFRDPNGIVHEIVRKGELRIIGDHNVENVLAAIAIAAASGIRYETIAEAIRAFPGVEHRIEYSGTVDGVKYYNDSKGTNVDAAVIALKALGDHILLIAGGDGKAQDFTELAENLAGRVDRLILLGRDAKEIGDAAERAGFREIYYEKDMNDCVKRAAALAEPGDKVLLSPACASWDMYDNYEQRGRHFKECVRLLNR